MAPDPLFATRILDLKAEPAKDEYPPGEDVVLTGTLEKIIWPWIGAPYWDVAPGERIMVFSGDAEIASGYTGTDGAFSIPFMLPFTPGVYAYRAHFPGRNWLAALDPCWSDTILVGITEALPEYLCPYCGTIFYTLGELEAHKVVCPYRPAEYPCPWCVMVFATEAELEAHKLVCPQRPMIPPEWEKYLVYGVIGLVAVGLVLMAVRR